MTEGENDYPSVSPVVSQLTSPLSVAYGDISSSPLSVCPSDRHLSPLGRALPAGESLALTRGAKALRAFPTTIPARDTKLLITNDKDYK